MQVALTNDYNVYLVWLNAIVIILTKYIQSDHLQIVLKINFDIAFWKSVSLKY